LSKEDYYEELLEEEPEEETSDIDKLIELKKGKTRRSGFGGDWVDLFLFMKYFENEVQRRVETIAKELKKSENADQVRMRLLEKAEKLLDTMNDYMKDLMKTMLPFKITSYSEGKKKTELMILGGEDNPW